MPLDTAAADGEETLGAQGDLSCRDHSDARRAVSGSQPSIRMMMRAGRTTSAGSVESDHDVAHWHDWRTRRVLSNLVQYLPRGNEVPAASSGPEESTSTPEALSSEEALMNLLDSKRANKRNKSKLQNLDQLAAQEEAPEEEKIQRKLSNGTLMRSELSLVHATPKDQAAWVASVKFGPSDWRRLWRVSTFSLIAVSRILGIYHRKLLSPIKTPMPEQASKSLLTTDEAFQLLIDAEKGELEGEKGDLEDGRRQEDMYSMLRETELGDWLSSMDNISTGQTQIPGVVKAEMDEMMEGYGVIHDSLTTESFSEACGLNSGIIWVSPLALKSASGNSDSDSESGSDPSMHGPPPSATAVSLSPSQPQASSARESQRSNSPTGRLDSKRSSGRTELFIGTEEQEPATPNTPSHRASMESNSSREAPYDDGNGGGGKACSAVCAVS